MIERGWSVVTAFTESNLAPQQGKIVVITGANTRLGYEAARALTAKGARVYIACRSREKAGDAISRIEAVNGPVDIRHVELNLSDLSSARCCAEALQAERKIDLLINNAGIMTPPYELTVDGFESQFGVNHLGHFALTALLLNKLEAAEAGRVVSTSSLAHRRGQMYFDDINAENGYDPLARYGMSKLANLLFAYELQSRLEMAGRNTISVACHPGIADTELGRYFPGWVKPIASIMRPFLNTAASGSWPTLCAATDPSARGGEYYGPSRRGQTYGAATLVQSSDSSHDKELSSQLWNVSVKMTGIDPGI